MAKRSTSFLITEDAKLLIHLTSKRLGIPKTAVTEMAIRLLARQEGVTLPTPRESSDAKG